MVRLTDRPCLDLDSTPTHSAHQNPSRVNLYPNCTGVSPPHSQLVPMIGRAVTTAATAIMTKPITLGIAGGTGAVRSHHRGWTSTRRCHDVFWSSSGALLSSCMPNTHHFLFCFFIASWIVGKGCRDLAVMFICIRCQPVSCGPLTLLTSPTHLISAVDHTGPCCLQGTGRL